jgi:hypothetical protein
MLDGEIVALDDDANHPQSASESQPDQGLYYVFDV